MEEGENVFKRLDENYDIIDGLLVQAASQREALSHITSTTLKGTVAKRKKHLGTGYDVEQSTLQTPYDQMFNGESVHSSPPEPSPVSDVAALAASALCQLSCL